MSASLAPLLALLALLASPERVAVARAVADGQCPGADTLAVAVERGLAHEPVAVLEFVRERRPEGDTWAYLAPAGPAPVLEAGAWYELRAACPAAHEGRPGVPLVGGPLPAAGAAAYGSPGLVVTLHLAEAGE